jgi:hypothetical protein
VRGNGVSRLQTGASLRIGQLFVIPKNSSQSTIWKFFMIQGLGIFRQRAVFLPARDTVYKRSSAGAGREVKT